MYDSKIVGLVTRFRKAEGQFRPMVCSVGKGR